MKFKNGTTVPNGLIVFGAIGSIVMLVLLFGLRRHDDAKSSEQRMVEALSTIKTTRASADSTISRFEQLARSTGAWGVVYVRAYVNEGFGVVVVADDWYSLPTYQQERLVTATMNMWSSAWAGSGVGSRYVGIADDYGKLLATGRKRADGTVAVELK